MIVNFKFKLLAVFPLYHNGEYTYGKLYNHQGNKSGICFSSNCVNFAYMELLDNEDIFIKYLTASLYINSLKT